MPQYDYRCSVCGGQQSVERSIHAEADNPVCCDVTMERVFYPTAVKFVGEGWAGITP